MRRKNIERYGFYINNYYLLSCFKERYGVTINAYLNQVRITYAKQQLRFTDKMVDGVSPTEFRAKWRGFSIFIPLTAATASGTSLWEMGSRLFSLPGLC